MAIVATAGKMSTCIYHMLNEKKDYESIVHRSDPGRARRLESTLVV